MILTSSSPDFIPILKHFHAKDRKISTLDGSFKQTLNNIDIPALHLAEAVGSPLNDEAFKASSDIIRTVQVLTDSLHPAVSDFFDNNVFSYLYPRLADLAYLAMALEQVRPKLILVHNDVEPMLRVVAAWARLNGVPCLHVPHAVYQDINRGEPGTDIHDIITATHLAATGKFQADWYIKRGFDTEKIRETGHPKFDQWATSSMDRVRARRLLRIDEQQPVVTYIGTWSQATNLSGINDEWQQVYFNFLDAIKQLPEIRLIVKLHPRAGEENAKWHMKQLEDRKMSAIVTPVHLEVVLFASDAVFLTYASNVALEASFVPDIRLLTSHGYGDDTAVLKVGLSTDEIAEGIMQAFSVPPQSLLNFQYRYCGPPDGKSSERIISFCEELLT